jgi:hypothetical protein
VGGDAVEVPMEWVVPVVDPAEFGRCEVGV